MHPNRAFRETDRSFHRDLVDRVGFGMVFCQTAEGPRVAHTPVMFREDDRLQFHLARGNAVARALHDAPALVVVNGPDAYVSARWYSQPDQVSTWNYLAAEFEGPVTVLERAGLLEVLEALTTRHEGKLAHGVPWTMDKVSDKHLQGLLKGIVGFEMKVETWRETVKLSQNKPPDIIEEVVAGLQAEAETAMASLMQEAIR